jgi:predicted membrane metal-binding protein
MYLAVFGAAVFGRPLKAERNLFFAALTLIFVNPELIFNLGFQLSVLSTLGLITNLGSQFSVLSFRKKVGQFSACQLNILKTDKQKTGKLISDNRQPRTENRDLLLGLFKMFSSDFQTSLSCFLFTAPLIIFSFGQINLLSIAVNVMVLWTIDLLMIGGGILIVLRSIGFVFVKLCALLVLSLLMFFKQIILLFSSYNFGVINFDWHGNTVLFLIFCLTCWIGFLIKTEKRANGEPNQ